MGTAENILLLRNRMKAYRKDCGCTMGTVFFLSAILLVIIYLYFNGVDEGHSFRNTLLGIVFCLCSAVIGKLVGIGIARIRLALLSRRLRLQYG